MKSKVDEEKLQRVSGGSSEDTFKKIYMPNGYVIYKLYGYQIYHTGDDLNKIFDELEKSGVNTSYEAFVHYCNQTGINLQMMYEGYSYPIPLIKKADDNVES